MTAHDTELEALRAELRALIAELTYEEQKVLYERLTANRPQQK